MSTTIKIQLSNIMRKAWFFVRKYGFSLSQALRQSWALYHLKAAMQKRVVKFYFQKVDGTLREAYGTLMSDRIPATNGDNRKRNDTVQVYYDTEKEEYRCFKKANLIRIAKS